LPRDLLTAYERIKDTDIFSNFLRSSQYSHSSPTHKYILTIYVQLIGDEIIVNDFTAKKAA